MEVKSYLRVGETLQFITPCKILLKVNESDVISVGGESYIICENCGEEHTVPTVKSNRSSVFDKKEDVFGNYFRLNRECIKAAKLSKKNFLGVMCTLQRLDLDGKRIEIKNIKLGISFDMLCSGSDKAIKVTLGDYIRLDKELPEISREGDFEKDFYSEEEFSALGEYTDSFGDNIYALRTSVNSFEILKDFIEKACRRGVITIEWRMKDNFIFPKDKPRNMLEWHIGDYIIFRRDEVYPADPQSFKDIYHPRIYF